MAVKLAPGFIGTRPNCFQFLGEIHIFLILTGTPCQKSPVLHVKPHYQDIHRELSIMMSEIIKKSLYIVLGAGLQSTLRQLAANDRFHYKAKENC